MTSCISMNGNTSVCNFLQFPREKYKFISYNFAFGLAAAYLDSGKTTSKEEQYADHIKKDNMNFGDIRSVMISVSYRVESHNYTRQEYDELYRYVDTAFDYDQPQSLIIRLPRIFDLLRKRKREGVKKLALRIYDDEVFIDKMLDLAERLIKATGNICDIYDHECLIKRLIKATGNICDIYDCDSLIEKLASVTD